MNCFKCFFWEKETGHCKHPRVTGKGGINTLMPDCDDGSLPISIHINFDEEFGCIFYLSRVDALFISESNEIGNPKKA